MTNALSLRPKWRLVDAIDATLTTELGLAIRPFRQQHEDLRLTSWVDDQPMSDGTAFTTLPAAFDLPALLDAMAARWPVDRQRVVLVGHSMGAMRAVAAAVAPGERATSPSQPLATAVACRRARAFPCRVSSASAAATSHEATPCR